jgi:hypothetical protein
MGQIEMLCDRTIASALALLLLVGTNLRIASAGQWDAPSRGVTVYVRDFELAVAPAAAPDPPNLPYRNKHPEDLQLRSRQVQDYFAETVVETLRKEGYSSSRKQALPGDGILLEGVFAEPDKKNRIRRALLGSASPGTKLILYVGVFNEKSVSQPLYIEAPVQEPDPNYGPVITLNAYIPMAKYEIEKDITEEDVQSICAQIAADLTVLLQRNPAALARATLFRNPMFSYHSGEFLVKADSPICWKR